MTTTTTKLFGTDGIRGVAGTWPLDDDTVARIGAATVRTLNLGRPARLLIGRDTRESGDWIERAFARGAASAGGLVTNGGVMPTPAVACLARMLDIDLGIVISASHNPYADNGLKMFSGRGEKFGPAAEAAVEAMVADPGWAVPAGADHPAAPVDLANRYLDELARILPGAGPLEGARIGVDMANGATTATAATLLADMGFELVTFGDRPDGRNINLNCGSTHPEGLARAVVERRCRMGVAFDGDGDRAIFVDAAGRIVDGDAVLFLLAADFARRGALAGGVVVATVMSNIGLELALRALGVELVRTPVGDKHVMEAMLARGAVLGGEQSGHIILAEHLPTGDGLATTLAVLRVMASTGRELADLAGDLVTYPQTLVNVRVARRADVESVPAIQAAMDRVTRALGGRGRLLVRYSGTEPLLRIMIEGEDKAAIDGWANEIADAARTALA